MTQHYPLAKVWVSNQEDTNTYAIFLVTFWYLVWCFTLNFNEILNVFYLNTGHDSTQFHPLVNIWESKLEPINTNAIFLIACGVF